MRNGTSSALNSEQDLASIPMAGGGLSRLAIARLKSAGVPVAPLLKRAGLTPEAIADPEERLSVRSQIALLDEAAIALKDDCLGFTLARDHDPREIGLLYYVMASSQTLGDGLKRVARYRDYQRGPRGRISRGKQARYQPELLCVSRHSERHQIEFCMFAVLRPCRLLAGQNLVPQYFSIAHHRSGGNSEMAQFVGTNVEFGNCEQRLPQALFHQETAQLAVIEVTNRQIATISGATAFHGVLLGRLKLSDIDFFLWSVDASIVQVHPAD